MRSRLLIGICLFLVFCCHLDAAYPAANPIGEQSVSSALFERFETVAYTKIDLLATTGGYGKIPDRDASRLRTPFALLVGGLDPLGQKASAEILRSGEAVWVGAKNFRAPEGLGLVRSQFCYVMLLKKDSGFNIHQYLDQTAVVESTGVEVWKWSVKYGEFGGNGSEPTPLFAAQVANAYFVIASDLNELQSVIEILSRPAQEFIHLNTPSHFESVSRHPFWCYRRYRHDGVINQVAGGMTGITRDAEALFFYTDADDKPGVLGLLSSPQDKDAAKILNTKPLSLGLQPHGSGAWQTTISFGGNEESFDRVFAVMGLFGFAIYL
jgi:hypothetical protein